MRLTVRLSMAVVALAAAMLSFQSLAHLGVLCGYAQLSWLFPLVVDAGAAAACVTWLYARGRQALWMTWSLLATSVTLNGTTHYLESTHTAPSWLLVVAVAAVPPTVLGLTVHLAVGLGTTERPGSLPSGEEQAEPSTSGVWGGTTNATQGDNPLDALIESGAGRRKVAATLGISEHAARQLLASRNGHADV